MLDRPLPDASIVDDGILLRAFLAHIRKVPAQGQHGTTALLLVKNGPFGPYRAHYCHREKRFILLEYRRSPDAPLRQVPVPERTGVRNGLEVRSTTVE